MARGSSSLCLRFCQLRDRSRIWYPYLLCIGRADQKKLKLSLVKKEQLHILAWRGGPRVFLCLGRYPCFGLGFGKIMRWPCFHFILLRSSHRVALLSVSVLQECLYARGEHHDIAENANPAPSSTYPEGSVSGQSPESRAAFVFLSVEDLMRCRVQKPVEQWPPQNKPLKYLLCDTKSIAKKNKNR